MYLQILSYLFIFSALVVAILNYKYLKKTTEKYFVYYLAFIFTNEMIILILCEFFDASKSFSVNLFDIVSFVFFIFWYYKILKNKKIVIGIAVFYFVVLASSLYFYNIFTENLNLNIYIGTLLLLILNVKFFEESLKSRNLINFKRNPRFWISTGLLAFYIGYLPCLFIADSSLKPFLDTRLLSMVLCGLLYSFFIKGFLCSKKATK